MEEDVWSHGLRKSKRKYIFSLRSGHRIRCLSFTICVETEWLGSWHIYDHDWRNIRLLQYGDDPYQIHPNQQQELF